MRSVADRIKLRASADGGFTMIIALGVMLVTSLLLVAAFTVANGDVTSSKRDTVQKQAYYASLAGIQAYEYKLQAEPDYWETAANRPQRCPKKPASAMKSSCWRPAHSPRAPNAARPTRSRR